MSIYLSFLVSRSFIQLLSVGCMVVGLDTAPVREVIDGQNGILVPFFDSDRIAENIVDVSGIRESSIRCVRLRDRSGRGFDLEKECLPSIIDAIRGE